ncbi:cylicin-2-like [Penaeus chinensis]|uniref:cylicin-2-like n=1 Tax=Penaeus chinensis TaxID=139456 RepID=UPI001FB83396|nr:cylicin-2-like [Penaeus chinensis]
MSPCNYSINEDLGIPKHTTRKSTRRSLYSRAEHTNTPGYYETRAKLGSVQEPGVERLHSEAEKSLLSKPGKEYGPQSYATKLRRTLRETSADAGANSAEKRLQKASSSNSAVKPMKKRTPGKLTKPSSTKLQPNEGNNGNPGRKSTVPAQGKRGNASEQKQNAKTLKEGGDKRRKVSKPGDRRDGEKRTEGRKDNTKEAKGGKKKGDAAEEKDVKKNKRKQGDKGDRKKDEKPGKKEVKETGKNGQRETRQQQKQ